MSFEIKTYSEEEDLAHITLWAIQRGLNRPNPDFHPECGFVVSHEGLKVCAAFLFKTDGKFTALDGVMSDPHSDHDVRDKALDILIEALLAVSRQYGFKLVSASTNNPRLSARYEKHGFKGQEKGLTIFLREEI